VVLEPLLVFTVEKALASLDLGLAAYLVELLRSLNFVQKRRQFFGAVHVVNDILLFTIILILDVPHEIIMSH
jgi:hypothetical protein